MQGLQRGLVKQTAADPEGQFRVLVTIPALVEDNEVWARLLNLYATNGAGSYFYPEIGDEVILGFINDDAGSPVILGSVYNNGKKPFDTPDESGLASNNGGVVYAVKEPPYTPDAKNTYKAIVTREKLKIEFDDDKKVIRILTPGDNIITLSDDAKSITIKDQNNNKVTLSQNGVEIISSTNLVIKAAQDIAISAGGNISIGATEDATITGMNVSAKADVQAKVQGSASAELSASGEVMIKGTMVMIN